MFATSYEVYLKVKGFRVMVKFGNLWLSVDEMWFKFQLFFLYVKHTLRKILFHVQPLAFALPQPISHLKKKIEKNDEKWISSCFLIVWNILTGLDEISKLSSIKFEQHLTSWALLNHDFSIYCRIFNFDQIRSIFSKFHRFGSISNYASMNVIFSISFSS